MAELDVPTPLELSTFGRPARRAPAGLLFRLLSRACSSAYSRRKVRIAGGALFGPAAPG
jgi:hypothetical protein